MNILLLETLRVSLLTIGAGLHTTSATNARLHLQLGKVRHQGLEKLIPLAAILCPELFILAQTCGWREERNGVDISFLASFPSVYGLSIKKFLPLA